MTSMSGNIKSVTLAINGKDYKIDGLNSDSPDIPDDLIVETQKSAIEQTMRELKAQERSRERLTKAVFNNVFGGHQPHVTNRRKPCPCGSGKRFKNCCEGDLP